MNPTASLVLDENFEFGVECMQTRMFAEELSRKDLIPRALSTFFKDGKRVATSLSRDTRGQVDREVNIKEIFSLIATLQADMVFMGGDTWYTNPAIEVEEMTKRSRGTFVCFYMTKEDRVLRVNSQPYMRDKAGRIFYLLNEVQPPITEVHDGLVFDLISKVFELETSPYATAGEHAEVLKGFGHASAIWDEEHNMQLF